VLAAAGRVGTGRLVSRLRPIGFLALVGLGVGMLGGGSTLIGFIVGPYLRAWDRIAILIAFFALAGLGATVTTLRRRVPGRWRASAIAGIAALLLVAGTFDQAGTGVWVRPYAAIANDWRNDAQFVSRVEQVLPAGAMVLQLPFIPFPENGRGTIISNDLVKPYLHSSSLRWSAGYMKGRDPGWQIVQSRSSAAQLVTLARALGFAGVLLHRDGYPVSPEHPLTAERMAADLSAQLGPPAVVDGNGDLQLWLVPSAPSDPQLAADAGDPVQMFWASGFDVMYLVGDTVSHRARSNATVKLTNPRPAARQVLIRFSLQRDDGVAADRVEVAWPDGAREQYPVSERPTTIQREVSLPAGESELRLHVPGAPPRGFATTMVDLAVVDLSLVPLLPPPPE
jgi:hypothetical protein